jgi:hypothetical protein
MWILRWAGILVTITAAVFVVVTLVASFSDGPIGPIAGGPFTSGVAFTGEDPDWEVLAEVSHVELQILEPPRSRTTNIVVYAGRAYIPCGIVKVGPFVLLGQAFWKRWPSDVRTDPRVIVRSGDALYSARVTRVADPELHKQLAAALSAKYQLNLTDPPDPANAWFYRIEARDW